MSNDDHEEMQSLERARADIEIIQSCYPDEIASSSCHDESSTFPFQFTLQLSTGSNSSNLTLRLERGYPILVGVQIADYRTDNPKHKTRLEAVVRAVRRVSSECQEEGIESCIACCAIATETWNGHFEREDNCYHFGEGNKAINEAAKDTSSETSLSTPVTTQKHYTWISGEPLLDKKSSFQAHLCEVHSDKDVRDALFQLLTSSSKIQRASHNMYAWRIAETISSGDDNHRRVAIKHDNDDDGEDAAGKKLAYLLDMRKDENVLVVVSRWFGGIHLGPKRFAHIVNVARQLLVEYTSSEGECKASNTNNKG